VANLNRHKTGNVDAAKGMPKVTRHSLTLQWNQKERQFLGLKNIDTRKQFSE
jgi:hypothetical protein